MITYGKIWGTTSPIFSKNNVEIFRIEGKKGGKSSNHKHVSKISMFFVEKGAIKISVDKNDYKLTDETILTQHQSTIIKPEEYHRFEILEDNTVAYEVYWVELSSDDIIRKDCGCAKQIAS